MKTNTNRRFGSPRHLAGLLGRRHSIVSILSGSAGLGLASGALSAAADPSNTATGSGALLSITTGVSNSAFGFNALRLNTTES